MNDQVDIKVHIAIALLIDSELVIRPAPDILGNVVHDEQEGYYSNQYSDESSALRACFVG